MKTIYNAKPIDTSLVKLPSELTEMTEEFAKNTHRSE